MVRHDFSMSRLYVATNELLVSLYTCFNKPLSNLFVSFKKKGILLQLVLIYRIL